MLNLASNGSFGSINTVISPKALQALNSLLKDKITQLERDYLLGGYVLLDVYKSARDDSASFIPRLVDAMLLRARLDGWSETDIEQLRSDIWKSAHEYMVVNVDVVDRGREIEEMRKALKLD